MPTLGATVTATTTTEVKLRPALRRKLLTELRAYATIDEQMKVLQHAKDKRKDTIGKIREEVGEQSISLEGFKVTLVAPVRSTLNKLKLIAQGVTVAMIEAATDIVPGKAYERITLPNEKEGKD